MTSKEMHWNKEKRMERKKTTGNWRTFKKMKKKSQEKSTEKAGNEGDELEMDAKSTKRKIYWNKRKWKEMQ